MMNRVFAGIVHNGRQGKRLTVVHASGVRRAVGEALAEKLGGTARYMQCVRSFRPLNGAELIFIDPTLS